MGRRGWGWGWWGSQQDSKPSGGQAPSVDDIDFAESISTEGLALGFPGPESLFWPALCELILSWRSTLSMLSGLWLVYLMANL